MKKFAAVLLILALVVIGVGCSQTTTDKASVKDTETKKELTKVKIGTLPTEDTLPIHVAQQEGLFKDAGLEVDVTVFKSAQERDAALQAGQIDGFMGDMVAAAALEQGGTPISIVSVLLGSEPSEGRFGILASPKSDIKSVDDLKGVPIAVSSNTIIEYVVDKMLKENGFSDADIKKIEIKAIPVRLEALMSGQAKAASLPDPLLAFAEKQGARLIIDDTKVSNLSQTILLFREDFIKKNEGAVKELLKVIDEGVKLINEDPDSYRELLVKEAKLPDPIAGTYKINTYPEVQVPAKTDVDRLLKWMVEKNVIKDGLTYKDLVDQEVQPN